MRALLRETRVCDGRDGAEGWQWLADFEHQHGRRLRVLHIGNIANNAYNNAKIQRARGIDADVLSFDYYHIMATPEWEDAEFSGDVGDPMLPDWWGVDLKGFRRPKWFVAGPLDLSLRYLLAMIAGAPHASWLWRLLQAERWLRCRRGKSRRLADAAILRLTGHSVGIGVPASASLALRFGQWLGRLDASPLLCGRLPSRLRRWGDRCRRFGRTGFIARDADRHLRAMKRYRAGVEASSAALFAEIGRPDPPDELEWFYLWWWHPYMPLLFRRYDVVQCYATYSALPYVIGRSDYVAYEHGTIRSIPFERTGEGRMCMASYRAAAWVMLTNLDNLAAAERMQLAPTRLVCLPHAFDSDKLERFARENPVPTRAAAVGATPPLFFTPTRQHWIGEDPGWAKGNDRVFRAMRLLCEEGLDFRLRAVAWGNDLERSRELLHELGVADRVEWIAPLKKRELWSQYLAADCVIDQFVVPAIGGVGFEAMILGRPVITAIDQGLARRFFGEAPPLFACRSIEEIAAAMRRVIREPAAAEACGCACREWMRRYHSADRIVELQVEVYRRITEMQRPPARQVA
jgi:glycosyltransferase involved in cell wall biosynthesis